MYMGVYNSVYIHTQTHVKFSLVTTMLNSFLLWSFFRDSILPKTNSLMTINL